jgi:tRNA threonylcarbamoyl adenosine modification protein (Sua5/YciO/YrdC/YwlC family)
VALLPAEGVYGLHALAADAAAVERLLAMKPRGPEKSFIGLIADPAEIGRWSERNERAEELARAHWPGALTLVLRALPSVPESMRHRRGTVALRCPGSEFLRAVVAGAGGLVISTSANDPGDPAMIRPEGPWAERVDLVVDQGALSGAPSTVVAVEGEELCVLREGAVRVTGRRT